LVTVAGPAAILSGSVTGQAATPVISPASGTYVGTQTVSITCVTSGSSIYYTIDGSTPTFPISGTTQLYTGTFTVTVNTTVQALAIATGVTNSNIGSSTIVISAAANFYIGPTGNDSNNGLTASTPWAITSLQDTNSNNSLIAGKVVGLLAGTYTVGTLQSGSSPGDFQHPTLHLPQGTAGSPTTVVALGGPGSVTLDNSAATSQNGCIGQNPQFAGYWKVDGIKIIGPTAGSNFQIIGRYNAFSFTSSSGAVALGIVVQNCEVTSVTITGPSGSNFGGVIMQGCSGHQILNNYFHDITKSADQPHCHCYEEYGCQNGVVHNNTFGNCPGGGIDLKAGEAGCDVGYNYFYNCGSATAGNGVGAITGTDGAEGNPNSSTLVAATIHHNIFDSCASAFSCDVNNQREQSVIAYNNTIYDTSAVSSVLWDLRTFPALTPNAVAQFYNNIVQRTANTGGGAYGSTAFRSGQFTNVINNCYVYHSSTGGWGNFSTTFSSLAAWQASTGTPDTGSITTGPTFVGSITPGNGPNQFKLGAG
jgi:hypothetical protein